LVIVPIPYLRTSERACYERCDRQIAFDCIYGMLYAFLYVEDDDLICKREQEGSQLQIIETGGAFSMNQAVCSSSQHSQPPPRNNDAWFFDLPRYSWLAAKYRGTAPHAHVSSANPSLLYKGGWSD